MLHRLFLTNDQAMIICRALRCYKDAVLQPEFENFVKSNEELDHYKAEKVNDMIDLADAVLDVLTDAD